MRWTTSGTAWEVGDPSLGSATGPPSANSGLNCAGTVIEGDHAGSTEYSLITPVISVPAGGATLTFEQFIDSDEAGDIGSVRVLDADNGDALIEFLQPRRRVHDRDAERGFA